MRSEACAWGAALALASVLLSACPGRIENPDELLGPLDCVEYAPIYLRNNCAGSGCHSTGDAEGKLDLESPDIAQRLLNAAPSGEDCDTQHGVLIDPDDPEASLLYTKMDVDPPCGNRMPLFARPATEADLECLLEWLVAVTAEDAP